MASITPSPGSPLLGFVHGGVVNRIIAVNLFGLALLVAGVLYLNQFRAGLIETRIEGLKIQGQIIAITVAEAASENKNATRYDPYLANLVLRRLALPTGVRVQIYDRAGRLTGDTRSLIDNQRAIAADPLPPPTVLERGLGRIEDFYERTTRLFRSSPPIYRETPPAGVAWQPEVWAALRGEIASTQRANSQEQLIVSVAVPVRRFKAVMGALVLSTEAGDIDATVRAERIQILTIFLIALGVSVILSFLLARGIARPLEQLAAAADAAGARDRGALRPGARVAIPVFQNRQDEIGALSRALANMTGALYNRIEAIESFAADVAHEIKNPLTSLRSAVETMQLAKSESARERLLAVIAEDVNRLDRLVTDISNASRLDAELVREQRKPFDLVVLTETVANIARDKAAAAGVAIVTHTPPTPQIIEGLETRLGQVLHNLVDNAISFSPQGGTITLTLTREGPNHCLTVQDDGPGIPPENLESIFERFYSHRPNAEKFGQHSGLGLSIARQIITAHDGSIRASNRGTPPGACFTVLLPA